jgi:hypothetical protein
MPSRDIVRIGVSAGDINAPSTFSELLRFVQRFIRCFAQRHDMAATVIRPKSLLTDQGDGDAHAKGKSMTPRRSK